MKLGNYKTLITLQKPTTTNVKGKVTTTWQTMATVYASVLPIRPVEAIQQGAVITTTSYTIRIHYRSDTDSTWRAVWQGKTLEISSVYDPDGKRMELELVGVHRA